MVAAGLCVDNVHLWAAAAIGWARAVCPCLLGTARLMPRWVRWCGQGLAPAVLRRTASASWVIYVWWLMRDRLVGSIRSACAWLVTCAWWPYASSTSTCLAGYALVLAWATRKCFLGRYAYSGQCCSRGFAVAPPLTEHPLREARLVGGASLAPHAPSPPSASRATLAGGELMQRLMLRLLRRPALARRAPSR